MKAIKYLTLGLVGVIGLASCSDSFIDDIKNYDNVNGDIYNYESGINGRLNDLYSWSLPDANVEDGTIWKSPSEGSNDIIGTATEEYSGFSAFVNPTIELTSNGGNNPVPDYFMNNSGNIQQSVYGRIRNINDFITNVQSHSASDEVKQKALGQAYFFRAWCYYLLMKWYGGVPLVTEVLEPVSSSFTPRSSARETKDFILSDLDQSARLLAPYTMNGGWSSSDFGRVTTGTALALKGRVLLLWASPLFNRANEQSRWTEAYNTMRAEKDSIDACGYHLYTTGSNVNGSDFAGMFLQPSTNPEAVFVTLYNNVEASGYGDNTKSNSWERAIRPANTTGRSGKNASSMLVDLFPMSDGKIPAGTGTYTKLQVSDSTYDANVPFLNRDPRFYRTFAFPGFRWAYSGNASDAVSIYPSDGQNYVLWNYCWYTNDTGSTDPEASNNYFADGLLNSGKSGVYVKKKSDDLDVNSSPLYNWQALLSTGGFTYSGAQCIELRYAEVLLNLAEAACGAGQMGEAVSYLQQIRARAGYTADNNYGLQATLTGDQATCMSAILYERQIEFAYEGKRMDDMRRWMLYDGGATQPEGAPADWTLTGWGGNTCTWLGVKPLNGQRRENMVFRVADSYGTGGTTVDTDPIYKAAINTIATNEGITTDSVVKAYTYYEILDKVRPAGVDLRLTGDELKTQMNTLASWYRANLVRQTKKGDAYDQNHIAEYINFRPKYYFLGFALGASSNNTGLPQTCGWIDYNTGSLGTFDPLAD